MYYFYLIKNESCIAITMRNIQKKVEPNVQTIISL